MLTLNKGSVLLMLLIMPEKGNYIYNTKNILVCFQLFLIDHDSYVWRPASVCTCSRCYTPLLYHCMCLLLRDVTVILCNRKQLTEDDSLREVSEVCTPLELNQQSPLFCRQPSVSISTLLEEGKHRI